MVEVSIFSHSEIHLKIVNTSFLRSFLLFCINGRDSYQPFFHAAEGVEIRM
jgi:hypothetical protein